MRQFSSDFVHMSWIGIPNWEDGFSQGAYIRETRAKPQWRQKANGYGDVVRLFNPDLSGMLTVTFDRESREHLLLTTLANADLGTKSISAPLTIRDTNTGTIYVFNKAQILVNPNYVAGAGPTAVPWNFLFAQAFTQVFGLDANIVGS